MPIDVVFVDTRLREVRRFEALLPNRVVVCPGAHAAVELYAGYCRRHPDYLLRIRRALAQAWI